MSHLESSDEHIHTWEQIPGPRLACECGATAEIGTVDLDTPSNA